MPGRSLFTTTLLAAATLLPAHHLLADSIFNYNLVAASNLTDSGGDIYGNALVGGNLTATGNDEFGKSTSPNASLGVAGNVTGGGNIQFVSTGTLTYGGTLSGGNPSSGTALHNSLSISPFVSEMGSDSAYFAGLTANSVFNTTTGNFQASPTAISGLGTAAVFNVNASDIFKQNENLNLTASGTINTIIINVAGTLDTTQGGQNFNGAWSTYASNDTSKFTGNIIWNFANATAVTLNTSIYGTILAPNATVTLNSGAGDVYGAVYANCINLTSGNEIRNDLYIPPTGNVHPNVPPGTPLPLSVWTGALLLTALGLRRLKSSRATNP